MSMIRKGRKTMNPIWNAVLSSEGEVVVAHLGEHEALGRNRGALQCLREIDLVRLERLPGFDVDPFGHRRHDEEGEEERQANQYLVRWRGLRAECHTQQREHDDDAGEARHHQDCGGDEGEGGEQQ
jgi:hypothetical protein